MSQHVLHPTHALLPRAFTAQFDAVERADPTFAAIHLGCAIAWAAAVGVTQAGEAITFGLLCAVAALRLPRTIGLYGALLRSPVAWAYLAFFAWMALSALWSENPAVRWYSGINRFIAVPFALWPLAHRAGTVAAAFAVAMTLHALAIIGLNVRLSGIARYEDARVGKELGMTGACLTTGILVTVACRWKVPTPLRAIRAGAALAMTGAIFVLSQRANLVALAIGATAAAVHGPMRSLGWVARIALACGALVAAEGTILAVPRIGETMGMIAADFTGGADALKLAHDATGGRSSLAMVAVEIFRERPVIGFGARTFGQESGRRILADPARYGLTADEATAYATFKTAHNGLLDEAAMRGAVGACLFLALLAVLLRAAWSDRTSITIAVLLAWIAFSMANGTTERGTFLAILAVIVVRCASVDAALRRR